MEITKKHVIIGSAILASVIIIIAIAMVITKENMTGATGSTGGAAGNLLAVDATGNLSVTNIETQLADSGANSGMMRYIGSYIGTIASATIYAQGATVLTMPLSGLTPGNTLIITALCPVYGVNSNLTTDPASVVLTAAVGTSGTPQTIYHTCWATDSLNTYTPPLTYVVTSDPSGGSTQTLIISVKSIYNGGTCTIQSPFASSNMTCTVMEVSK